MITLYPREYNAQVADVANRRTMCLRLAGALVTVGLSSLARGMPAIAEERVTVFAAASLKNALDEVNSAWKTDRGSDAAISYAASSALARQIEQGAPADIFISADPDWMNYLAEAGIVAPGSVVRLLGNEIVLIAPRDSPATIRIERNFALADLVGSGKLAMADVKAVPAGKYGKAALEWLGVWSSVQSKVAQSENVRAALKLVAAGEAELGIVYRTDALADPAVRIIGVFPAGSHTPIIYPAAQIAASENSAAAAFLKFLQSPKARSIFEAQGFSFLASGS
jgi:molybdate transport system substrate-binding protein